MMQTDVLTKIDDVLNKKPAPLIVHDGTNDLTNDINLLSNVKNIVNKTNKTSPNTADFFKCYFSKRQKEFREDSGRYKFSVKNFCRQKKINLISNDNMKEKRLGIKKLHLKWKGNSIFAKNL